jgi:AraC-like DNA-binding protein
VHDAGSVQKPRDRVRVLRIRTDDWPERDRAEMFREIHGRDGIRVEPRPNEPLQIDAMLVRFPELGLLQGRRSPLRSEFADGHDRLMLNLGGPAVATQFGRELFLDRGDAIALSGSERGTLTTLRAGRIVTIDFPQGRLVPLLKQPRHGCARQIPKHSLPLRLLRGYVRAALADDGLGAASAGLPPLAIAHIYDLAAMAVGAARAAEEIANGRGVRAGRLQAIKNDILVHLEKELSLGEVAARHGVSPRYVGMLFEDEGTSMTEFVREERLKRARAILLNPIHSARRIAEVAYEVGFNDLSYFNRTFRRRFGHSPSEARELAMWENA